MYMSIFCLDTRIREAKRIREAGPDQNGPGIVKKNPQGGYLIYPFFSLFAQVWAEKHRKKREAARPLTEAAERILGGYRLKPKREADSSTLTPAVTAAGQKRVKESTLKIVTSQFREAAVQAAGSRNKFRVALIEEGLGNLNDAFYYTRECLESGIQVFNGLKIYADHPSLEEEEIRPERSTRDILGHYENLAVEEDANGQAQLCADLDVLPSSDCDWARARMVRAIENREKFPDRDFIGLSINASGPSSPTPIDDVMKFAPPGALSKLNEAKEDGVEIVRVVTKFNRAVSADLVTEAGAGGKILNAIKGADDGHKKA